MREVDKSGETVFYDSVTGRPLFVAPRGRTFAEWEAESRSHGWPSFRDEEVIWDDVRVLPDGEAVSTAGTHLVRVHVRVLPRACTHSLTRPRVATAQGHNLPDRKGACRQCARTPACTDSLCVSPQATVTASTWSASRQRATREASNTAHCVCAIQQCIACALGLLRGRFLVGSAARNAIAATERRAGRFSAVFGLNNTHAVRHCFLSTCALLTSGPVQSSALLR